MKNPHFKILFGLGTILPLAIGLGSSVFAGPGPQYWTQMEKLRAENAVKLAAPKSAMPPAMACGACKTMPIRVYHPEGAAGKIPARYDTVGTKHTCDACGGGAITVVRGNTTNDMTSNCAICAKEKSACCTKSN